MADEITNTPAPTGLTAAPPAATPAAPGGVAPIEPEKPGAAPAKPAPGAEEWAKRSQIERQQRERSAAIKKTTAELEAREKGVAEQEAVIAAIRSKDPAKIIELIGIDGFQKVSTHLLQKRVAAPGKPGTAPAAKPAEDVNEVVRKAIEEHEANREKKATEERQKTERAAAVAADERFGQLTKQAVDIVTKGGDRFAQIAKELTGSPEAERMFDSTLRSIDRMMTSGDGFKVGDKVLKGQAGLDSALDLLENYLVDRAVTLLSDKARARLSSHAEKPAEEGGTRKSTSDGPKTLTQRLSTETPPSRSGPAPENESPLARKQREESESLARAIAETEAILAKQTA